ncbi:MAG: carbohydrate ABC transporter permease [Chloroflexi bacterium]|nr:carbohydrate ABC transporter permease [Chloroflexota bacterium]
MKRRSSVTTFSLYAVGTLYGAAVLFPIVWMLMLALKSQLDAFAYPPLLIFEPTLEHFSAIFQDEEFLEAIGNSVIISSGSVFFAMLFAIPATFALTIMQGRVRRNALLTILLIRTAPGMIYLLPYFVVYSRLGLLDTHMALIIIYLIFNVPLIIWTLMPVWSAVPRELRESGMIDGASLWQILFLIELPLVRIGIIASGIVAFLFAWNEFLFAVVISANDTVTLAVAITRYMGYEGTEWGKLAAAASVMMLPGIIFGFLIQRYMVTGLTAGAIKG